MVSIEHRRKTRALLDAVIKELNKRNRDLWDVLTALRGPDTVGSEDLKYATTAVIRNIVGLKHGRVGATVNSKRVVMYFNNYATRGHFECHVNGAVDALRKLGYRFKKHNID